MYFRRGRRKSNFSILRRHKSASDDSTVTPSPSSETPQCLDVTPTLEVAARLPAARAVAVPVSSAVFMDPMTMPEPLQPPAEMEDSRYQTVVLQLPSGSTEVALDDQVDDEAEQVGLPKSIRHADADLLRSKHLSKCESDLTALTRHVQSGSTSRASHSTGITSVHSVDQPGDHSRKIPLSDGLTHELKAQRSMSFNEYQTFLAQARAQEKISAVLSPPPIPSDSFPSSQAPSVFSTSSKKTHNSFRKNFKRMSTFRRFKEVEVESIKCCHLCSSSINENPDLVYLRCKHSYCKTCLGNIISESLDSPSTMPPSCCSKPIPPDLVMQLLPAEQRSKLETAIRQHALPLDDRMFCPTLSCGNFDPGTGDIDRKRPLQGTCEDCGATSCKLCKGPAHPSGLPCPSDWHNVVIARLDPEHTWRRCYACRKLVQRDDDFVRLVCQCGTESCYKCGAIWDPITGCPNDCIPQNQLDEEKTKDERRQKTQEQLEEEAAAAVLRTQEEVKALQRSLERKDLQELRSQQTHEMDRFLIFEKNQKSLMWTRHQQEKIAMLESHALVEKRLKEKHFEVASIVEDRQVNAEMELRKALIQEQKSMSIRLRHMEAYVNTIQRHDDQPARVVSDRDRNELGQQHNIRDDMDRLHQARINVLRDKQAQQLEALSMRQEEEHTKLLDRSADEVHALEERSAFEERAFDVSFQERRVRLTNRWRRVEQIARKKLEIQDGVVYGPFPRLQWYTLTARPEEEAEASSGAVSD
ncbi:MAG: hypothetical protein M1817_001475 [Caeruleum heppii]|nr:MAG: hypothetical protein M1817_001475 [Caeruleum heppii]